MTFEPDIDDCKNPETGSLCPMYIRGNGHDWTSKCLFEENPNLEANPPSWCPLVRTDEKIDSRGNYDRVTRLSCLNCGQIFDPGNRRNQYGPKKFCSYQCRWDYNNRERLEAKSKLITMAKVAKAMAEEILNNG